MVCGAPISRRDALATIGGGVATISGASLSSAGYPLNAPSGNPDPSVRVTVGFSRPAGERAAREYAREVIYEFAFGALTVLVDEEIIAELRGQPGVRYVERDSVYRIAAQETPWGIDRVDADDAHEDGETGEGADVAIIDTGIDDDHEDLAPNLGQGVAFTAGAQHTLWQDDNGHGTHVAGIAAAVDNDVGVVGGAPAATLHAVKVLTSLGVGLSSDVAKGIEWAADQGHDVANLSVGGDDTQPVVDACQYAHDEGLTLVAAVGNDGSCEDCVNYPAAYDEVIAVSATNRDDDLADFSSQGPEVDLAAPGVDIYSTDLSGYDSKSGTSMATPHVSGAAAHLAAAGYANDEIRRSLVASAEKVGLAENEAGAGLLDVAAAIDEHVPDSAGLSKKPSNTSEPPTPTDTATPTSSEPPPPAETATPSQQATATETATPTTSTSSPTSRPTETSRVTTTATQRGSSTPTPSPAATPTPSPSQASSKGVVDNVVSLGRSVRDAIQAAVHTIIDVLS